MYFDELATLLVEIEAVVNARPLTYVHDDEEGISYPLSPSHLIYGRRIAVTPNQEHQDIVSTNQSLTRRIKYHRKLLSQFTRCWQREYLTSLREQAKAYASESTTLSVGDVVLLAEPGTARCLWKLARVEELLRGEDGVVRAAKIRVNKGLKKASVLRRPIQLLVPTEVQSSEHKDTEIASQEESSEKNGLNPAAEPFVPGRLRRQAAIAGEQKRRLKKD